MNKNQRHALYLAPAGPPGSPDPDSTASVYSGKSAVIDNSLDKQKTFTFKGRGFFNMSPSDDGSMNVYSSKIIITETSTTSSQQYNNNYGYRNYNTPTYEPNFVIYDETNSWESIYSAGGCGEMYMQYGFPITGVISTVDNLYIKDIEVKLNHLNYPNSKNLVVWLDIKNPGIPSVTSSGLFSDHKSISDFSSNSNLQSYFNALSGMNTHTSGSMSRIYLLNQEHISNYETNFSLKFSDNVDKNTSTNLQNHTHSSELGDVVPVFNNSSIHPTLYAMGYNDLDSILYSGNIKTNKINSPMNSFVKFKNIPLKNTEFILNIGLISQLDHSIRVMDNLIINDLAVGGNTTENHKQSNTLNNSLCSWEIKVHTDNIRQNSNQDILGKITYSDFMKNGAPSLVSGYNFIGNFSGVPYLIPAGNINAPHDYLANINKCFYDDPNIGRGITSLRPTLQQNLATIHLAFLSYSLAAMGGGLGVGTLSGAMAGIYSLAAVYATGGRNDPIINMFIEKRLLDQTDAQNSQFYKPVYRNKFFGSPDRAIICISTDNIYWYTVDVPIFRLINSLVLEKNTYKYIKLRDSIIPNVSNFNYKTVRNYTDLDLAPVVHTFKSNVSSLSGLSTVLGFPDSGNVFVEGDMVLLTAQTTFTDNGYYMVSSGSWTKVPATSNSFFLQKNNIGTSFTEASLSGGTHIILDGIRAYNFFDKGESIALRSNVGTNSATVQDKSYIQTFGGVKTILTLSSGISAEGTIYKDSANANVLLLYKDKVEPIGSKNTWMLEKTKNQKGEPLNPDNFSVAYGEGSINSGSDILDPSILYKMSLNDNEILETNKLLNNQENDKLKFNQVIIDSAGSTQYVSFTSSDLGNNLLKGYSYTAPDFLSKVYDTDSLFNVNNLESRRLDESLLLKDFASQSFMEIKSDKFKGITIPDTGSISIENDFQKFIPISFSDTDWTNMGNRLTLISTGDGDTYLKSLYHKYYSLPADPSSSGCYAPGTYSAAGCPKTETLQSIKVLEEEKRQLQYALMSPRADSSVTVPFITGVVTSGSDGSYKVRYQSNDYYYWFSLDPEQQCTLSDELSAKILKTTSIKPIALNEGAISAYSSQIIPNVRTMSTGIDEILSVEGLTYTYEMTSAGITKEKSLWPSTINWDNGELFTYGGLGSTGDSKKIMVSVLDSSKSIVVPTEEIYIRPSGTLAKKYGKVKDRIDLANIDNLSVKFKNIPRKLRSLDSEDFEKYTYNKQGDLIKTGSSAISSVGYVANNFTCWHCINPSGQYIENIPPYYKLANEMRYRAFFGSVDGIENKNTPYLDSKEDWEWIPYEYYYDTSVSSGPSSGEPNYGSIAVFLDNQKPATSLSQPLNYFSVMNVSSDTSIASGDDTPGMWKVYITYISRQGKTKTIETSMGATSKSNLYNQLDKEKQAKSNIYSYYIDKKLPPYQGPIFTFPQHYIRWGQLSNGALYTFSGNEELGPFFIKGSANELDGMNDDTSVSVSIWDSEKDTDEMTPDRILDFEIIKIKKLTYIIPACSAGPEQTHYSYSRTEFRKNGEYIYYDLDYTIYGGQQHAIWRPNFSGNDFDPFTNQPILKKIDLAKIFHETFDELDALRKEYRLLIKAKMVEEAKIEGKNYDIIYKATIRMQELEDKRNQIFASNALFLGFVQKIEHATGESGAFLGVNPEAYPCAENPGRVEPYWINYWLYGRILWNSTKDLGAREQRLRYQEFYRWPEKSADTILNEENGNVF